MGTNYYYQERLPCMACGRPFDERHIGKSSVGWCFLLRVYDDIQSLEDWKKLFDKKDSIIRNEYRDIISKEQMLDIITNRYGEWRKRDRVPPFGYTSWDVFYKLLNCQDGPNGLFRWNIGDCVVGHGEGTWDLIDTDFS